MRNNNTFGISYPTGSIGRYSTEELKEMKSSSNETINNTNHKKTNTQAGTHKDKSER